MIWQDQFFKIILISFADLTFFHTFGCPFDNWS